MTARDVLVGLLGEARAVEVIEAAARSVDPRPWDPSHLPFTAFAQTTEGAREWEKERARESAAAALAAVLPDLLTPEVITTREEADALPDGVVVLDGKGWGGAWQRVGVNADLTGSEYPTPWRILTLPLTVLYRPKEASR